LITADQLPECLDYIRSQPGFDARTRAFEVSMPVTILAVDEEHRPRHDASGDAAPPRSTQAVIDAIGHLQDIGVTWTSVPMPPSSSLSAHLENLHRAAEEIMPAFREKAPAG
jgi:hypothetical protein